MSGNSEDEIKLVEKQINNLEEAKQKLQNKRRKLEKNTKKSKFIKKLKSDIKQKKVKNPSYILYHFSNHLTKYDDKKEYEYIVNHLLNLGADPNCDNYDYDGDTAIDNFIFKEQWYYLSLCYDELSKRYKKRADEYRNM